MGWGKAALLAGGAGLGFLGWQAAKAAKQGYKISKLLQANPGLGVETMPVRELPKVVKATTLTKMSSGTTVKKMIEEAAEKAAKAAIEQYSKAKPPKGLNWKRIGETALGFGLASLVVGSAAAVPDILSTISLATTEQADLKRILKAHPDLAQRYKTQPDLVRAMFKSIRRLNPVISRDPIAAGSLMRQMLRSADEGSASGLAGPQVQPDIVFNLLRTRPRAERSSSAAASLTKAMLEG